MALRHEMLTIVSGKVGDLVLVPAHVWGSVAYFNVPCGLTFARDLFPELAIAHIRPGELEQVIYTPGEPECEIF